MDRRLVLEDTLFIMLYAGVTMAALIACCYLLFRRGNAFAPEVTSPVRLRRWAAAFLATMVLCHLWWMLLPYYILIDNQLAGEAICMGLDCVFLFPAMTVMLLTMLQDRRRPHWIVAIMIMPVVVALAVWVARPDDTIEQLMPVLLVAAYILFALYLAFFIYMIFAVRQYGKWLRDNYADLEHKEVWQTFIVLACILLLLSYYVFGGGGQAYEYILQIAAFVIVCYLLWRIETLSDLSISQHLACSIEEEDAITEDTERNGIPQATYNNISSLLQRFCIDTQLYLQNDLTLQQLAQAIGTNRTYLTNYFSNQGMTYNTYINNLRIDHFVSLYNEAVAHQRSFTARQLACDSGYRNYATFSIAFKQRMGQNVSAWMHSQNVQFLL